MKKIFCVLLGLFVFSSTHAQGLGSKNKVRKLDALVEIGKGGSGTLGIKYSYIYFNTASGYFNFTSTTGSGGYGFRDNSGTMQVKNSGGSWANIAGASGSAGGWTDDGTDVRLTTASDNVGIGTATPGAKLDVEGDVHITGGNGILQIEGDATPEVRFKPTSGATTTGQIYQVGDVINIADEGVAIRAVFNLVTGNFAASGKIGIGTTVPDHGLHIDGGNIAFGDTTTGDHDAWIYYADDGDVTSSKSGFDDGNAQFEWWIGGNQAMKLGTGGILYVDDTGSGSAAQVDVFDKYNDIELIRAYVIGEWEKLPEELFVSEKKETIRHNQLRQLIGGALLQLDTRLSQLEEKNK